MKKLLVLLWTALVVAGCEKDKEDAVNEPVTPLDASAVVRRSNPEMDRLVRAWAEWTQGRSVAVSPVSDPDGKRQYDAQPFPDDVFLLAGASDQDLSPGPVFRSVDIDVKKYPYVLLPLVNLTVWYDACDPAFAPAPNQKAEDFFQPFLSDAFGQGDNNLKLVLDNKPVIGAANLPDLRVTSGVWSFRLDPSQNNGCTADKSTAIIDGYWALVKLTPGKHSIEIGGSLTVESAGGFASSNHVIYTLNAR